MRPSLLRSRFSGCHATLLRDTPKKRLRRRLRKTVTERFLTKLKTAGVGKWLHF